MRFPGLAQSFLVFTFRMTYRVLRCIHTQFQMRLAVQWIYIWISLTFSCHCLKSLVNVQTTECYSGTVLRTGRFFVAKFSVNAKNQHIVYENIKNKEREKNMPKLKCKNKYCKFYRGSGCSKKSVTLDRKGRCETYEPGFAYYFFYCCEHMQTNFLTYPEVNAHPAYKYSIYYMTKCLPVECYSDDIRGMLVICDSRTKKPLKSLISEVFCYFIVYCGAFFEVDFSNQDCPSLLSTTLIMS